MAEKGLRCKVSDHNQKDIILICLNSQYGKQRLACSDCLRYFHIHHANDLIDFSQFEQQIQESFQVQNVLQNLMNEIIIIIEILNQLNKQYSFENQSSLNAATIEQWQCQAQKLTQWKQIDQQISKEIELFSHSLQSFKSKLKGIKQIDNFTLPVSQKDYENEGHQTKVLNNLTLYLDSPGNHQLTEDNDFHQKVSQNKQDDGFKNNYSQFSQAVQTEQLLNNNGCFLNNKEAILLEYKNNKKLNEIIRQIMRNFASKSICKDSITYFIPEKYQCIIANQYYGYVVGYYHYPLISKNIKFSPSHFKLTDKQAKQFLEDDIDFHIVQLNSKLGGVQVKENIFLTLLSIFFLIMVEYLPFNFQSLENKKDLIQQIQQNLRCPNNNNAHQCCFKEKLNILLKILSKSF